MKKNNNIILSLFIILFIFSGCQNFDISENEFNGTIETEGETELNVSVINTTINITEPNINITSKKESLILNIESGESLEFEMNNKLYKIKLEDVTTTEGAVLRLNNILIYPEIYKQLSKQNLNFLLTEIFIYELDENNIQKNIVLVISNEKIKPSEYNLECFQRYAGIFAFVGDNFVDKKDYCDGKNLIKYICDDLTFKENPEYCPNGCDSYQCLKDEEVIDNELHFRRTKPFELTLDKNELIVFYVDDVKHIISLKEVNDDGDVTIVLNEKNIFLNIYEKKYQDYLYFFVKDILVDDSKIKLIMNAKDLNLNDYNLECFEYKNGLFTYKDNTLTEKKNSCENNQEKTYYCSESSYTTTTLNCENGCEDNKCSEKIEKENLELTLENDGNTINFQINNKEHEIKLEEANDSGDVEFILDGEEVRRIIYTKFLIDDIYFFIEDVFVNDLDSDNVKSTVKLRLSNEEINVDEFLCFQHEIGVFAFIDNSFVEKNNVCDNDNALTHTCDDLTIDTNLNDCENGCQNGKCIEIVQQEICEDKYNTSISLNYNQPTTVTFNNQTLNLELMAVSDSNKILLKTNGVQNSIKLCDEEEIDGVMFYLKEVFVADNNENTMAELQLGVESD